MEEYDSLPWLKALNLGEIITWVPSLVYQRYTVPANSSNLYGKKYLKDDLVHKFP